VFKGVDEIEAAKGEHLGYSEWHEITQQQVNLFAEATGDHQWIHVDVERARSGPFGGPIAHGFLTLALLPVLTSEVYAVENVTMTVNYGAEKLRFPAPVPVGARVRGGIEVVATERTANGLRVVGRVTVEIEGQPKPACVVDSVFLYVS